MKTIKAIITTVIAATAANGVAQEPLNKEITVDKEIVPQEREAQRLQLTPQILRPELQYKKLDWSSRAVTATPENGLRLLPPAPWEASVEPQPYRGYVAAGYMPTLQLGLSAGYRLLDTEQTTANVALQYSGMNYKGRTSLYNGIDFDRRHNRHYAEIGADIRHAFAANRRIEAGVNYMFGSYTNPVWCSTVVSFGATQPSVSGNNMIMVTDEYTYTQKLNRVEGNVAWSHELDSFKYAVGVSGGYFGFGKLSRDLGGEKGVADSWFKADGSLAYDFTGHTSVGVDVSYARADFSERRFSYPLEAVPAIGNSVFDATAYFRTGNDYYSIQAGVHFSSRGGDAKGNLVYPDVRLSLTPSQQFSFYARCGGGNVRLNTLGEMWDADQFVSPTTVNTPSFQKWSLDGGMNIGPFVGMTLELWYGYTRWGSLAMPWQYPVAYEANGNHSRFDFTGLYASQKFTGIHYGAALNYSYGRKVAVRLSYEGAPDGEAKGYSQWLDRAKSEFKAQVKVNPTEKLGIGLAYGIRTGRKVYMSPFVANMEQDADHASLGTVASLDLKASYNINKRVTVWANVENILNRRWQICYGVVNPGVTGLVGATYKF